MIKSPKLFSQFLRKIFSSNLLDNGIIIPSTKYSVMVQEGGNWEIFGELPNHDVLILNAEKISVNKLKRIYNKEVGGIKKFYCFFGADPDHLKWDHMPSPNGEGELWEYIIEDYFCLNYINESGELKKYSVLFDELKDYCLNKKKITTIQNIKNDNSSSRFKIMEIE